MTYNQLYMAALALDVVLKFSAPLLNAYHSLCTIS